MNLDSGPCLDTIFSSWLEGIFSGPWSERDSFPIMVFNRLHLEIQRKLYGELASASGPFSDCGSKCSFFIRVVGLATMQNSTPLQEVLESLLHQGMRRFIFDLKNCSGFDSTFMGILLGIALGENGEPRPGGENKGASVFLVNVNHEHSKLLAGVGIDRLVQMHTEPIQFPPMELTRLEGGPTNSLRRIRSIISAHENLVRLGGQNQKAFSEILEILKRELGENEFSES